ncbi:MAG: glutamine--tRNA ligase/YqeY domain fusion protein [Clostridiales bacterium]|nr:glutamine--tRNA ligase/YqeY domain fusion protein [Clostridiales bacterium]
MTTGRFDRGVCVRFPPEPNGYLHIGHAKAICIDFGAALKYGGKCNLRFDDTNPVKEDTEYVNAIQEDVHWLGFEWDGLYYASDYFEKMYLFAEKLIEKGLAYVDDQTAAEIAATRGSLTEPGKESPFRNREPEENLALFREMQAGRYADGEKVLRAKINMASPNINLRDPVIYRISHTPHHNTGEYWKVYPMYDFAHPLEDAIENVTHSLCTLEFEDHRPLYNWVLEALEWPFPPRQIEFARLELTHTVMSKRYLKELVDGNVVEGWDDPRMPTIAGIRRRGYTPEAVRTFCDEIGVAKKDDSKVDIAMLEHIVREDLKAKAESRNVIFNPVKLVITNYPEGRTEEAAMENSRENPELGERFVPFSRELWIDADDFMEEPAPKYFRLFPGNEVRLKGAYFVTCTGFKKDADGEIIEIYCTYDPGTKSGSGFEGRKVKGTIHWVEATTALSITVREYDYLFEDDEDGGQRLNENSARTMTCRAEPSLANARPGARFQFFRHGYYIADAKLSSDLPDGEKVFNQIVGLKSSWK